jgi:hypothetical protein
MKCLTWDDGQLVQQCCPLRSQRVALAQSDFDGQRIVRVVDVDESVVDELVGTGPVAVVDEHLLTGAKVPIGHANRTARVQIEIRRKLLDKFIEGLISRIDLVNEILI